MALSNSQSFDAQSVRNTLQSLLLIAGMLLLLALLKWILIGEGGLLLLLVAGGALLYFGPRFSPHLLLRLYRAVPLSYRDAPALFGLVRELSSRAGLPALPRLYYIPSHLINAITMGTRRNPVVAVTDGLLRQLNARELAGTLAHEIAHVRNNDIWVMGLADVICRLTSVLSLLGQMLLLFYLFSMAFQQELGQIPWLVILILIFAPALSSLLQLALSRTREFNADLGAVELTGDPRGLASALLKLEQAEASLLERIFLPGRRIPEPSLLRTHPAARDRVERLADLDQAARDPLAPAFEWQPRSAHSRLLQHRPRWHVHGLWY